MKIKEAIQLIVNMNILISPGAKQALVNEDNLITFVNEILEQYYETEGNKETLTRLLRKEVIDCIIDYANEKNAAADFLLNYKQLEENNK